MFNVYNGRLQTLHGETPSGYIFMEEDDLFTLNLTQDQAEQVMKLVNNRLNDFVHDVYSGESYREIYHRGYQEGWNSKIFYNEQ